MADPYLGEIRMFAGNFAPVGWAICDGSTVPISQNDALYSLIGTTYGGDGQTTFALPDLRGRAPMHKSTTYPIGSMGGAEEVTLVATQMPAHTHTAQATSAAGASASPANAVWAAAAYPAFSDQQAPNAAMSAQAISAAGGSQPHENMMPFLAINFIIATAGIYPAFN